MEDYDLMYGRADYHNKIVLDVGADWGSTALFFLSRGARQVISVECNPELVEQLRKTAENKPIIALGMKVRSIGDWEHLINTYNPDIIKSDCEGCEESLLTINDGIFRKVREYVIEAHGKGIIIAFKEKFERLKYRIADIYTYMGDAATIFYAVRIDELQDH